MNCPRCGAADLAMGTRCGRCGEAAPMVVAPPGFMPPAKLELTGAQLAVMILVTFLVGVTMIFGALFLFQGRLFWLPGLWGPVGFLVYLVTPPTIAGVLVNRYFLAKNLAEVATTQATPPPGPSRGQ